MALKSVWWLWLIWFLPLLGALLNGLLGKSLGKGFVRVVAVALPTAAFLLSVVLFGGMLIEDRSVVVRGPEESLAEAERVLSGQGGLSVKWLEKTWARRYESSEQTLWVASRAPTSAGAELRGPSVDIEAVRADLAGIRDLHVARAGELTPRAYECDLGAWISVPSGGQTFQVRWGFLVDHLSIILLLVITGVGSLIHLYSTSYMDGEDAGGFARYFCYLNLFLASMLVLVMAKDLLVLFIGWEGVGMCSYLLIGFHYQDRDNAACGTKAFVVNRIGDVGFVLGMLTLLMLVKASGEKVFSLDASILNQLFATHTVQGLVPDADRWQGLACLLLFIGACGKSAQLPLQLWLPDAMAGPTPVSALIHAATMVTAGVYMISRLSFVFAEAVVFGVPVLSIVALVGVLTAFYAASSAIAQDDIKRVLAYSTISQLGYMFVGVGALAFGGAVFHLVTHAFFKALLFLGAGSVIHAVHTQSMRQMGGLRHHMPTTYLTMVVGGLCLAGIVPLSGFFSKDLILGEVMVRANMGKASYAAWMTIYALGAVTAGLTAVYTLRMIALTFLGDGPRGGAHPHESPRAMTIPLVVLALLAALGGLLGIPHVIGHSPFDLPEFVGAATAAGPGDRILATATGAAREAAEHEIHKVHILGLVLGTVIGLACAGIGWAWWRGGPANVAWENPSGGLARLRDLLNSAWYYDEAVNQRFAQPVTKATAEGLWRWVDDETIDRGLVDGTGRVGLELSNLARSLQTGRLSTYATYLVLGAVGLGLLAIFTNSFLLSLIGHAGNAGH